MLKKLYSKITEGSEKAERIQSNLDDFKDNYQYELSQYTSII